MWCGKARDGKLTIEDMAGGTFTISNVCSSEIFFPEYYPLTTFNVVGRYIWFADGHAYYKPSADGYVLTSN